MIFTSTIENDQLSEIVGELSAIEEVFNSEIIEEEAEAEVLNSLLVSLKME